MRSLLLVGALLLAFAPPMHAQPVRKEFGLDKRVPWTTSKVIGSPEPPPAYRAENAFPKIKLFEPLDLSQPAGSDRLLLSPKRRDGKVFSFENKPTADKTDLALDLPKMIIYGMTFHPNFADNGYIYLTYLPNGDKELPNGSRVARFTVKKTTPPTIDRATRVRHLRVEVGRPQRRLPSSSG